MDGALREGSPGAGRRAPHDWTLQEIAGSRGSYQRQPPVGKPARYRLRVEILLDEGTPKTGWPLRFVVDQEVVDNLRKATSPEEDDWSSDGQDREIESIYGEALRRRLAPRSQGLMPPKS